MLNDIYQWTWRFFHRSLSSNLNAVEVVEPSWNKEADKMKPKQPLTEEAKYEQRLLMEKDLGHLVRQVLVFLVFLLEWKIGLLYDQIVEI